MPEMRIVKEVVRKKKYRTELKGGGRQIKGGGLPSPMML